MNQEAILNMLQMQHRMNSRVHEDWISQHFEWYRATWIECGELMDHVGYKWWKKQTSDMEQVRLEVVDIWHFGMSALFEPDIDIETLADRIHVCMRVPFINGNELRSETQSHNGYINFAYCHYYQLPT